VSDRPKKEKLQKPIVFNDITRVFQMVAIKPFLPPVEFPRNSSL